MDAQRLVQASEHAFEQAFAPAGDPLKQLGALAVLMFLLLAASGAVLFVLLETSVAGAYRSIEALSHPSWGLGGLPRGMHRYAADAFAVLTVLHLLREALLGRFRHFRRFSWWTGLPLLPMLFACGIVGFWLHWDRLGQFSALATAQWLDGLPFFSQPLARNFMAEGVSDRLFSLFVFIHLGVPLLMMYGLWMHLQRLSHTRVLPTRALAWGSAAALLLLSLAWPVRSQGPADLGSVPARLSLDWVLLFLHPLTAALGDLTVWALLLAALVGLALLPAWRVPPRAPAAVVDPDHCNGCQRCEADCPFAAVTMAPHPSGRPGMRLAVVDAARCAGCGICVASCPSSTPFRKARPLATGIDLPQPTLQGLRLQLEHGLAQRRQRPGLVVAFGCDQGARVDRLDDPDLLAIGLPCTGMLPPSFVEYALRNGAAAVMVAGCREGGCEFRLGPRWTALRLAGQREPHLRSHVPPQWRTVWADAGEEGVLLRAAQGLRRQGAVPTASEVTA